MAWVAANYLLNVSKDDLSLTLHSTRRKTLRRTTTAYFQDTLRGFKPAKLFSHDRVCVPGGGGGRLQQHHNPFHTHFSRSQSVSQSAWTFAIENKGSRIGAKGRGGPAEMNLTIKRQRKAEFTAGREGEEHNRDGNEMDGTAAAVYRISHCFRDGDPEAEHDIHSLMDVISFVCSLQCL